MLAQDMTRFFGVALVLNLIIFGVTVAAKGKLAQPSATDIVQRILNTIVAAVPIGVSFCLHVMLCYMHIMPDSPHCKTRDCCLHMLQLRSQVHEFVCIVLSQLLCGMQRSWNAVKQVLAAAAYVGWKIVCCMLLAVLA